MTGDKAVNGAKAVHGAKTVNGEKAGGNPSRATRVVWPAVVFVAGVGVAAAVSESIGLATADMVKLLWESVVGAAAAGIAAALLLVLLRRSRITVQVTVAALAPVAAVAIGVTWATSNMFITEGDFQILWVVLVSAGAAGVATALILGGRVAQASESVGEMARRLGEIGPVALSGTVSKGRGPGELASLAAELSRTSRLLAEAQLRAEDNERSRRELVAWVSHDLRTPLAGIKAMIEALEDGVVTDTPNVQRYYATIRLEADRLAGLVDDLFELSRIHSGVLSLALTQVPLDELLTDALEGAGVSARAKGVQLSSAVCEPAPLVDVSTSEMIRVVRNLLDNAIRHTPRGGTVTLAAGVDPRGQVVEVSVLDECGGIPPSELEQVFEVGYRGDVARTPGEGRGGLGLAVAQGLVQAHEGQITVRNEEGGCRFTVRLPLHRLGAGETTG